MGRVCINLPQRNKACFKRRATAVLSSTVARLQHDVVSDVEFNSRNDSRMERLLPKTKHKKERNGLANF